MKNRNWITRLMAFLQPGIVPDEGGGAVDRGDDFTPTDDDDVKKDDTPEPKVAVKEEPEAKEEPETKDEAKDDDADEEGEETDPKPKKKDARIPLSRHKEILEKERATRATLEAQLAQFQQGGKVADLNADITATENEVLKLEKEYSKLLTDGEVDKASDLMAKIRKLEREMAVATTDMKIQAAVSIATENARYNLALERVESAFPQLNPDHDDFDESLMSDVADLKVTYQRRGMTATEALQKAVKTLVRPATAKQEDATEIKPKVDPKAVAAERKKAAVQKVVATAAAQPPNLKDIGMDSDKAGGSISAKDVIKMSYKDFSALPEETLAKMRGDML